MEDALDALEHAIALSEARQEVPADNVTKRVAELYRRIQRTHSRCQRLSIGASEIRSTCDSEASGVLQSISLTDDLTISMLRESELVKEGVDPLLVARSARATTAISARASRPSAGAILARLTPAPAADSHSDDDSDGDLVAPTYGGVFAPNQLGPMASFLSLFQRGPRQGEVTDSLGDLLARLADASVHRAIAAEHSKPSFTEIEAYYDSRPELSAFTLSAEIRRMDYAVVSQAGHACITDPARIQQLYAEGGGASAASCCGQCELIWRMANQSLVPYLLQPLLTRWMDPASGSTVCASACRFELDLPRQTLRCECTLLISCTSEHGERVDVASCDGIICVSLPARSFMQTVSVPRALVNPDGTSV